MSNQQPVSPEPCEHHWIHYGQPSHSPIRWIVKCSQCNQFKIEDLQEQVDVIEAAAEQRGAERGFERGVMTVYARRSVIPNPNVPITNPYRADRMEGGE